MRRTVEAQATRDYGELSFGIRKDCYILVQGSEKSYERYMCQILMVDIWTTGILNQELRDEARSCSETRCLKLMAVELHGGTNSNWLSDR